MEKTINNRRTFLKKLGLTLAAGLALPRILCGQSASEKAQQASSLPLQVKKEPRAVARQGSR